VETHRKAA